MLTLTLAKRAAPETKDGKEEFQVTVTRVPGYPPISITMARGASVFDAFARAHEVVRGNGRLTPSELHSLRTHLVRNCVILRNGQAFSPLIDAGGTESLLDDEVMPEDQLMAVTKVRGG